MDESSAPSPDKQTIGENPAVSKKFVFHVTLPTLQKMAAHRLALEIWYSYVSSHLDRDKAERESNDTVIDALGIGEEFREECDKMVKSLKTPSSIEEILKFAMESVHEETRSWIIHFQYLPFSDNLIDYRIKRFDIDCCVWSFNGKINYANTAAKMLFASELTLVQRFVIMSEFCMEDELEKFPWRSLPDSFASEVNFNENFLTYYWICYLKQELVAIPLDNFASIDALMAATCEKPFWTAFEYFWNRLGDDDQISVAEFRFDRYNTQSDQDRVLSKMSWQQQQRLLSKMPDQILLNFWVQFDSPESALWTWNASKDLITPKKFARIVDEMFLRSVRIENELRLLLQIWRSASDQQKNYVAQTMEEEIIRPFLYMRGHCRAAFEFLYIFLSSKDVESRKQLLLQHAEEFAAHIEDPNCMNEVVQLCLPNPADRLEYKKLIMQSHELLRNAEMLFNDVQLENLILKVKSYSADARMSQQFLYRLLESKFIKKMQYFIEVEKWNKFSQFVDEIFSQDIASALNLKKRFITNYAQVCPNDWNENSLNETIEILKMVLTTDEELQLVKKYLLDSFQKLFVDYDYWQWFDEKNFNRFLFWCLNEDEKAVAEFIERMSVDAIFDAYFKQLEDWYEDSDGFMKSILQGLNKCLRWYFKGVQGAREYKLKRINAFEQIKLLQMILQRKDESSLDAILKWIFDGDEEDVRRFKIERIKL